METVSQVLFLMEKIINIILKHMTLEQMELFQVFWVYKKQSKKQILLGFKLRLTELI